MLYKSLSNTIGKPLHFCNLFFCRDLWIQARQIVGGEDLFDIEVEAGKVQQLLKLFKGDLSNIVHLMKPRIAGPGG